MLKSGHREQAAGGYRLVLEHNPREFWALFKLVALEMEAGNATSAAQVLTRGLSFYPDSPLWIALRGKYRASTGDLPGGVADAEAAVAAAPHNPSVWKEYLLVAQVVGDPQAIRHAQDEIARLDQEW
jgi:hypothetical protein